MEQSVKFHSPRRWMMRETSLDAYDSIRGKLNKLQRRVLDALHMRGQATNMEIAQELDWTINRVTPRMFELRTQGLVVAAVKRKCHVTGTTAIAWRPL